MANASGSLDPDASWASCAGCHPERSTAAHGRRNHSPGLTLSVSSEVYAAGVNTPGAIDGLW